MGSSVRLNYSAATVMGLLLASVGVCSSAASPDVSPRPAYRDAALSVEARIDDLLARMTLEEKVAQMQGVWQKKNLIQDAGGRFSAAAASKSFPDGIGQVSRPGDRVGSPAADGQPVAAGAVADVANRDGREAAQYANAAQRWAVEETRLGIPLLFHEEALHGFVARGATSFPQAIALASTWDPALVEQVFSVAAREMRLRGAQLALSPVLDIVRDPRWGRSEETYGEDPHLVAEIGLAAIRGLQGETLPLADDKVFATLKHLAGHGQPENGINVGPAPFGERMLRENFLPPFKRAVETLPIRSVMASYNEIDGVPSHVNPWLLGTVLRSEWGFEGAVVSDYFALRELETVHHMVTSMDQAAARALAAGVDVELPDGDAFKNLPALVRAGKVSESRINAAVRRVLRMKFEAGLFENPYVDAARADAMTATPDAIALAREAAARAIVLLKNDGELLPLDPARTGTLLVVGPHARDTPIGGYSDKPGHVVSVLEGLENAAGDGLTVEYAQGVRLTRSRVWEQDQVDLVPASENAPLIAEAVEKAKLADVVVLVLGENEQLSREAWAAKHLGDRASLDLVGQQEELASRIFALGKPTIVILLNGRPLSVNLLAQRADALLEGWYLGQETGNGLADVLFGKVSPGGKLPVTIPRSAGQLPVYYSRKPSARRGYLFDDASPLYPFGFGLTYSRFELGAPRLSRREIGKGQSVDVTVRVSNAGKRRADQVVQVYLRDLAASVTRPVLELKHFRRVTLAPGATDTVTFTLTPDDLSLWNDAMQFVQEPGQFSLLVGFDSVEHKTTTLTVR